MLVVLLGLGTWQVQRLHWKLGVLAQIARAEAGAAGAAAGGARSVHQGAGDRPSARRSGRLVRRRGARYADRHAARHPTDRAAGTRRTATPSWSIAAGCRTSGRVRSRQPNGDVTRGRLCAAGRHARAVQRHGQSRDAAVLHARSRGDRRGARPAACRAVRPGGAGAAAAGTLSRSGAAICRGRRTTICRMRSPGMASRSRSW